MAMVPIPSMSKRSLCPAVATRRSMVRRRSPMAGSTSRPRKASTVSEIREKPSRSLPALLETCRRTRLQRQPRQRFSASCRPRSRSPLPRPRTSASNPSTAKAAALAPHQPSGASRDCWERFEWRPVHAGARRRIPGRIHRRQDRRATGQGTSPGHRAPTPP